MLPPSRRAFEGADAEFGRLNQDDVRQARQADAGRWLTTLVKKRGGKAYYMISAVAQNTTSIRRRCASTSARAC